MITALTVCQPWAWAIIHGPKRIENRTWCTKYRGRLYIHAGKSRRWMTKVINDGTRVPTHALVFGAIIGSVDLVACVPIADPNARDDPFAEGPYCWMLENPIVIEPMPINGKQGLWRFHASMLEKTVADNQALLF